MQTALSCHEFAILIVTYRFWCKLLYLVNEFAILIVIYRSWCRLPYLVNEFAILSYTVFGANCTISGHLQVHGRKSATIPDLTLRAGALWW